MYFEGDPDIEIVGEARNGEEALQLAETLAPQVVLMDLLMPVVDGFQATKALRQMLPRARVLAMTSVVEEAGVHRAIEAGAIGYVLKDARPDDLRDAVLRAGDGRVRFPPESAGRLMQTVFTPDVDPLTLSAEDRRMLSMLAAGLSTAEMGDALHRAPADVETDLDAVLARLNMAGRAQAVLYAARKGLVPAETLPYLI
jgi:DNA-binding NarL/FixJ family response regulator